MSKVKQFYNWYTENTLYGKIVRSVWSWIKKTTGSGMTDAEKESSDTSLRNAQQLAEDDFQRKIDFYERFESPEAQVRQYKEAGLNPALMYGNGASVSASGGVGTGSAPAQSMGVVDALGSLLGFMTKQKQLRQDRELTSSYQDIQRFQAETARMQAENYGAYLAAATKGQNITNEFLPQFLALRNDNLNADSNLKANQAAYFTQLISSEGVRRDLMRSGITLNDSQSAVNAFQASILEAQSKYSVAYFKAVSEYETAVANVANIESDIATKLKDSKLKAAEAELCDIIIKAGMDARVYQGEGFEKMVQGKMTDKDKTNALVSVIRSVITAGTAAAIAGMRMASKSVIPPMVMSPQQQYQFYNATGYRFDTTL